MSHSTEDFVHIQSTWTDLSNITRAQWTTKKAYDNIFKKNGFSLPYFTMSLPYMDHPPYERVTGEVQFFPDDDIPRPLPWMEGTGIVFGKFVDGDKPWGCCPRSFLHAQEEKLKALDINMMIGFELEFYLLNLDGSPVDGTGYGDPKAFRGKPWQVISGVVAALETLNIPVWKYHPEAAHGQFEISLGPFEGSMLKAADSLVLARQAIHHVATSFGLNATLAPKPFEKMMGSSIHMHLSLWDSKGKNLFASAPDKANSFLAGMFNQLPNTMLILCPAGNSYDRLGPFGFSGGAHCIGYENRKAAIRLFRGDDGLVKRLEMRNPDGASNPHLVVGTFIGAGIHGIVNESQLAPMVDVDPDDLPETSRPPMLPNRMSEAIRLFAESSFNRELYGEELYNTMLLVRRGEEAYWSSDKEPRESKMKVLLDKY